MRLWFFLPMIAALSALSVPTRPLVGQETTAFVAASADTGVALRWAWAEGARPVGYFVERRPAAGGGWTRITAQPVTRVRDRAAARALLAEHFDQYETLLFPGDPRIERADPESFRGFQLLAADLEPAVARVLGLRWDDRAATRGESYQYRLVALTAAGERVVATSGAVLAGRYAAPLPPEALTIVQGPAGAALRWSSGPLWSAYSIYRGARRDGSDARRINLAPVVIFSREDGSATKEAPAFFTDSTAPRQDTVYYQVEGIDGFGRASRRTASVAFAWRNLDPPPPPPSVQAQISTDTVIVSWVSPPNVEVGGFQVWRSESSNGPFTRVGGPVRGALQYRDAGRPSRRISWYRLTTIDRGGNESEPSNLALAEVPDLTPPGRPDTLRAVADTGRLSLRWRQVAAADLLGYRVYRAALPNGTFTLLTSAPRRDTAFTDTIPVRADHAYYYRVTAVDSAYNESAPSPVAAVRPPDGTPPSVPRIASVAPLDAALIVTWLANPEADVASYRLRYRVQGDTTWHDVPGTTPSTQHSDTISGLTPGRLHHIILLAVDDAGNRSLASSPARGEPVWRRPPTPPELRRVASDRGRSASVTVEWTLAARSPNSPATPRTVFIARRESEPAFRIVGTASVDSSRWVDRAVRRGVRYEYVVRVMDGFGNVSESRPRKVDVPKEGS